MIKIFVKWSFTDDYGYADEDRAKVQWFDTIEDAEAFVTKMKRGNGGYFKLWKIAEGNYEEYERMNKLYEEYLALKKVF
jgi:hypothetical protein